MRQFPLTFSAVPVINEGQHLKKNISIHLHILKSYCGPTENKSLTAGNEIRRPFFLNKSRDNNEITDFSSGYLPNCNSHGEEESGDVFIMDCVKGS